MLRRNSVLTEFRNKSDVIWDPAHFHSKGEDNSPPHHRDKRGPLGPPPLADIPSTPPLLDMPHQETFLGMDPLLGSRSHHNTLPCTRLRD